MAIEIPRTVLGWKVHGEIQRYDRKTLFDYIDGGAELYLAYGFGSVQVFRYTRPGGPEIVMDVYDMGTPKDAFGVFTAEREGRDAGIGEGSEYDSGLLRLHKGRYFISITAYEETPESKEAVLSLGRAVAGGIPPGGEKPSILRLLPEKGLVKNSVRYFTRHSILNLHHFVAEKNILHITPPVQALLARYGPREESPYLLLVQYPDEKRAKIAAADFARVYMPEAGTTGMARTENARWTVAKRFGRVLAVVFDAETPAHARGLLQEVGEKVAASKM